MMNDLFAPIRTDEILGPGAFFYPGAACDYQETLMTQLRAIVARAPLRQLVTPGGRRFSVEMTNCGMLGWHSDRGGYRYEPFDPLTGHPWPALPENWTRFARDMAARAGFRSFDPQACLINCYAPGARMGLHQDRDEKALDSPVVSVSLGLEAGFLFGGLNRTDPTRRVSVLSGDVLVWGGKSRLVFHGIAPLRPGCHELTGERRWNLTFRRVHAG